MKIFPKPLIAIGWNLITSIIKFIYKKKTRKIRNKIIKIINLVWTNISYFQKVWKNKHLFEELLFLKKIMVLKIINWYCSFYDRDIKSYIQHIHSFKRHFRTAFSILILHLANDRSTYVYADWMADTHVIEICWQLGITTSNN